MVNPYKRYVHESYMGLIAEKWRCPKCNIDVGGSMGELKNHMKRMHAARFESRVATAA